MDSPELPQIALSSDGNILDFRALTEADDRVLLVLDKDGRVLYGNARCERLWNRSGAALVGENIAELLPAGVAFEAILRGQQERLPTRRPTPVLRIAGRWFEMRVTPWSIADVVVSLQDVSEQHIATERSQAFAERQQRIAETLQRSLLLTPDRTAFTAFTNLEVEPLYEAAGEDALVGGDFFDAFALDATRVALVVGDVTGKGMQAASYTAEIKYALRALLRAWRQLSDTTEVGPVAVLAELNRQVSGEQALLEPGHSAALAESIFVCLTVAVIDSTTGNIYCASAGAEPPVIRRVATGRTEPLGLSGPMLGVLHDWRPSPVSDDTTTEPLQVGDILLLFTDGLTEARAGRNRPLFGVSGLLAAADEAARHPHTPLLTIGASLFEAARQWAGGALSDDSCLLLARRTGPA